MREGREFVHPPGKKQQVEWCSFPCSAPCLTPCQVFSPFLPHSGGKKREQKQGPGINYPFWAARRKRPVTGSDANTRLGPPWARGRVISTHFILSALQGRDKTTHTLPPHCSLTRAGYISYSPSLCWPGVHAPGLNPLYRTCNQGECLL